MKKIIVLISFLAVIGVLFSVFTTFNDTTYTVTVTKMERIYDGESSFYLVFAEDNAGHYYEFKNSDQILRGKVNSSTFYNQIKVGNKYEFTVVGMRIPLLSKYQNIIKVKEVD